MRVLIDVGPPSIHHRYVHSALRVVVALKDILRVGRLLTVAGFSNVESWRGRKNAAGKSFFFALLTRLFLRGSRLLSDAGELRRAGGCVEKPEIWPVRGYPCHSMKLLGWYTMTGGTGTL